MIESDLAMPPEVTEVVGRMPIVSQLVGCLKDDGFSFGDNVLVFGVQHLMGQSLGLCWALNELGLSYDRLTLCGKPYSTNTDVLESLRRLGVTTNRTRPYSLGCSQAEEQVADLDDLALAFGRQKDACVDPVILVIDDGGHALTRLNRFARAPYQAAGLEQTASGFWQVGVRSVPFPIVDVGASAVKRICEPGIVIDAALKRALSQVGAVSAGVRCGVVGLGYIGSALAVRLAEAGAALTTYDVRPDAGSGLPGRRVASVHEVFDESDVIFGCAGSDITLELFETCATERLRSSSRLLISMSSGDDEFFALKELLIANSDSSDHLYTLDKIPDIVGHMWGSKFRILRNGFPINFDNSLHSAPLEQIQGTIAALIGAACQAYTYTKSKRAKSVGSGRMMLDVDFQRWLYPRWSRSLDSCGDDVSTPTASQIVNISSGRAMPPSIDIGSHFGAWARDT